MQLSPAGCRPGYAGGELRSKLSRLPLGEEANRLSDTAYRHTSLSALLGRSVGGAFSGSAGRISEFLLDATHAGTHVTRIVLTRSGTMRRGAASVIAVHDLSVSARGDFALRAGVEPSPFQPTATTVRLEHDLLDQQIIDVSGHKVVRVNDVDLVWEFDDEQVCSLRIAEVEVGLRGAVRRILKGLPPAFVDAVARQFGARVIPWEFVDLIDRDPARRVRLKIEGDRLSRMHPSDIAEILEDLAPAERDAVFTSLDEEVAAEALEEADPKLQRSLLEGMDSTRVAGIVEEMDPGAAADLLAELSEERSDAILQSMEAEERQEVEDLLEFPGDWAAGRMTTDYIALPPSSTVAAAVGAMRAYEGDVELITELYLTDSRNHLQGVVNLARILMASPDTELQSIQERRVHTCTVDDGSSEVAELFDKYNLRSLAVLDHGRELAGVIYAEQVIALLREGK